MGAAIHLWVSDILSIVTHSINQLPQAEGGDFARENTSIKKRIFVYILCFSERLHTKEAFIANTAKPVLVTLCYIARLVAHGLEKSSFPNQCQPTQTIDGYFRLQPST